MRLILFSIVVLIVMAPTLSKQGKSSKSFFRKFITKGIKPRSGEWCAMCKRRDDALPYLGCKKNSFGCGPTKGEAKAAACLYAERSGKKPGCGNYVCCCEFELYGTRKKLSSRPVRKKSRKRPG